LIEPVAPFTTTQARKSTLLVAVILAAIGGWQVYRERPNAAMVLGGIALVLLLCAAIAPAARFFHKWWMTLAGVLGYVNSRIILSALFFLIMTPIGVVLRLTGHDPLSRRQKKSATYWHARKETRQQRQGFERSY
jgi:hypothetical protein